MPLDSSIPTWWSPFAAGALVWAAIIAIAFAGFVAHYGGENSSLVPEAQRRKCLLLGRLLMCAAYLAAIVAVLVPGALRPNLDAGDTLFLVVMAAILAWMVLGVVLSKGPLYERLHMIDGFAGLPFMCALAWTSTEGLASLKDFAIWVSAGMAAVLGLIAVWTLIDRLRPRRAANGPGQA